MPLGRPVNIIERRKEGDGQDEHEDEGIDLDYAPVYGAKWCTRHQFLAPHNSGTYRNQIDLIRDDIVIWHPYDNYMAQMPIQVQNDQVWWLARVPLIHF